MTSFVFQICIFATLISMQTAKQYYIFRTIKLNWHGAFADCLSRGLQLATVNSEEEYNQLEVEIRKANAVGDWMWLAGTDLGDEGSFVWMSTAKSIAYNKWAKDQPDNAYGGEDCVHLFEVPKDVFSWNDLRCIAELHYICEDKTSCAREDDD